MGRSDGAGQSPDHSTAGRWDREHPAELEILTHGSARPGARRIGVVALAAVIAGAVLLAALAGGVRWWDDRVRTDAAAEIERAYLDAATAVLDGEQQVRAMLAYAGPLRTSPSASPDLRADLTELVRVTADTALVRIDRARADLADVRSLPWQDDVQTARGAAIAWLDARSSGLRDTAESGEPGFADLATVDDLRDRLRLALSVLS